MKRTRSALASRMIALGKSVALSLLFTALVLAWLAVREGLFDSPEALDELVARTCLGVSELRVRGIVPARRQPVELTANSIGVSSMLGRLVLQSVSEIKSDKLHYQWGIVKLEGGKTCLEPATREDTEPSTR